MVLQITAEKGEIEQHLEVSWRDREREKRERETGGRE